MINAKKIILAVFGFFMLEASISGLDLLFFLQTAKAQEAFFHDFTGLPLTADGWTDINSLAKQNSRIVYVSSSDGNDSLGVAYSFSDAQIGPNIIEPIGSIQAYATISAGYSQLRDGYSDIILLKRGDVWDASWPNWDKSGESPMSPMIVGAYGSISAERPKTGQFRIGSASNLIVSDLELPADTRALNAEGYMSHVTLEGLFCPPGTNHGMAIQNPAADGGIDHLALRRNVIAGRQREAGSTTYVQGIYIDDSINLLLEENIFDQNGWEEGGGENSAPDLRSHNTYIMLGRSAEINHQFRNNISTRGRSHGIQAGSGGLIYGNLSVQDAIGINASREDTWWDGGYSATIEKNVVLHGRDISSSNRRGWGINIANSNNTLVSDNIIGANEESGQVWGIRLNANNRSGTQMYVRNVVIDNNIIHNWDGYNIVDGEAIGIYSANYVEGDIYAYGSDPQDYIQNISITNNHILIGNPFIRVLQGTDPTDIVNSSNNRISSAGAQSEWFYFNGSEYDLNGFKSLVGDVSSEIGETNASGNYGITDYLSSIGETATLDSFYEQIRQQRKGNWDARYTAVAIVNFVRDRFARDPINPLWQSGEDIIPPVLSSGFPQGKLSQGDTQATISVETNENATCKYSEVSGVGYDDMVNTFTNTGSTTHTYKVSELAYNNTYAYYVRCQDSSGNANQSDYSISFTTLSPSRKYDLVDFVALFSDWLTPGTDDTDLNFDNIVNPRDLGIMMSGWE